MLYNSMDLSRLMVHVQQVNDSRMKWRVSEVRNPNPFDHSCSSRVGGRSTYGVCDLPKFMKRHQSSRNSNCHRSATAISGRPEPKKGNRGDVQHLRKEWVKFGRIHSAECRLGTNDFFGCGKSRHIVRDCLQNRSQDEGNSQPA